MSQSAEANTEELRLSLSQMLKPDAKFFYEKLFSVRHVGRVLDFMLFESRAFLETCSNPDYTEYRCRQVIELAVFNAWSNYRKGERAKCVEIEFGSDKERFIVSVTHYADSDIGGFVPETGDPQNETSERISKMLSQIQELSDGLIVRFNPKTGQMQVMALVSGASIESGTSPIQFTQIEPGKENLEVVFDEPKVPAPLAEAKLNEFLTDEQRELPQIGAIDDAITEGRDEAPVPIPVIDEETLVTGTQDLDESAQNVKGGALESESSEKVTGALSTDDSETQVKGGIEKDKEVIKIAGSEQKVEDKVFRMSGGGKIEKEEVRKVKSYGLSENDKKSPMNVVSISAAVGVSHNAPAVDGDDSSAGNISTQELQESSQTILDTLKAEIMPLCSGINAAQFDEAYRGIGQKVQEGYAQAIHHLMRMKNIQTLSKFKHFKDQIKALSTRIDELKAEKIELVGIISQKDPTEGEALRLQMAASSQERERPLDDIKREEFEYGETVTKYQEAVQKGDVPQQAQGWAKGFLDTLLKERALLNQRVHDTTDNLRKYEQRLKDKESALKETIRSRDEALKQKDLTIDKTKESLTKTLGMLEKTKAALAGDGKNEAIQKAITLEKLLENSKDTNEKLHKRVDDLQKKWHEESTVRGALHHEVSRQKKTVDDLQRKLKEAEAGASGTGSTELKIMTQERDRAVKVIDELRRQTRELQGKVTQATAAAKAAGAGADTPKKPGGPAPISEAELKHKLDQSNKLVKAMKEELERTRKRFDELKKQETTLRVEVGRLQGQLKTAQKGGSGKPPGK